VLEKGRREHCSFEVFTLSGLDEARCRTELAGRRAPSSTPTTRTTEQTGQALLSGARLRFLKLYRGACAVAITRKRKPGLVDARGAVS
jgi:hypothetical protein